MYIKVYSCNSLIYLGPLELFIEINNCKKIKKELDKLQYQKEVQFDYRNRNNYKAVRIGDG